MERAHVVTSTLKKKMKKKHDKKQQWRNGMGIRVATDDEVILPRLIDDRIHWPLYEK